MAILGHMRVMVVLAAAALRFTARLIAGEPPTNQETLALADE
jgi:hypothetical protein